ncbi:class A beta-lactamase-related serine hydrolase [Patescibacteria group bacterium]|nr:class A beta-lactamase-related serine hydrolase [Patescibacteria group bacterium]
MKTGGFKFFLSLFFPHKLIIFFYALFLIIGLLFGKYIPDQLESVSKLNAPFLKSKEIRLNENDRKYTNPLLECDVNQSVGESEFKPSKKKVEDLISSKKSQGSVTDVAVYYRDLNNGPWFGINEKNSFTPASLLKLPVMIAYLKKSEGEPGLLEKKIKYTEVLNPVEENYKSEAIEIGKSYSLEDLITRMIVYSDNNALSLLEKNINESRIEKVMLDLGIETANSTTPSDYMSVKSYASLFRVLYNASYLNQDNSEKALKILDQVKFDKGLTLGVPKNITVAHKFGERDLLNGIKQLHDCGIVYYPKHPYLICVMTRGNDYNQLSPIIGEISTVIYKDIEQRFGK